MAQNKSIRNRDNEGSKRHKRTLTDHRRNGIVRGYQDIADVIFNDAKNKPKR